METPPVSNTAHYANPPDGCATDSTNTKCPQARKSAAFRVACELEEEIKSRRMRDIFHIGAIDHLYLWFTDQSPFVRKEEKASIMDLRESIGSQEQIAAAIGWKELIDLCLLAEVFDSDFEVKVIRLFRFKSQLESMPDSLMAYIYKRTIVGSAFREAVVEERIFREEPLKEFTLYKRISYPRAFLLDLVQGQTRYFSSRGYLDNDGEDHDEEYQDEKNMYFQLARRLTQLGKILDLATEKGKVNSAVDEETDDEETDDEETVDEETEDRETEEEEAEEEEAEEEGAEDEEMEDEEMEDEEIEDDTNYDEPEQIVSQQEAEGTLRSIAKLITK